MLVLTQLKHNFSPLISSRNRFQIFRREKHPVQKGRETDRGHQRNRSGTIKGPARQGHQERSTRPETGRGRGNSRDRTALQGTEGAVVAPHGHRELGPRHGVLREGFPRGRGENPLALRGKPRVGIVAVSSPSPIEFAGESVWRQPRCRVPRQRLLEGRTVREIEVRFDVRRFVFR